MEQDGIQRKQIKKRLTCIDTLITKWKNVGFDDPKAFLDGIRTDQDLLWWDKLLITDPKVFLLDGGRNPKHKGRWVYDSEELDLWEVENHSKGLHVYGGMTSKGLTQLVFINGNIDGERYVNEVLPTLTDVQERIEETDDITKCS
ncbi:unnamed protein product [Rotaria sp. Silwood2]|nr:unnamed protein product [Rotaria sp. Silwood2]